MISCPKCSGRQIAGPFYRSTPNMEWLVYRCIQCGYQEQKPTHDAKMPPRLPCPLEPQP